MTRRYCGRVGGVVRYQDGARCPECGSPSHMAVGDEMCGAFAECPASSKWTQPGDELGHGHMCALRPGHAGDHRTGGCR